MITSQPALQRAIYSRLTADAVLSALISGVFDEVPTDKRPPYLVIDNIHEMPSEAHDRGGVAASVVLSAWSTYRGYSEVAQISDRVNVLLHRVPLAVSGFQSVSIANESHQFMRDPDPDLRRCVLRYRVWLESLPE